MITIKNLRKEKIKEEWQVRVDRASILGNPFVLEKESQRDKVCDDYAIWFDEQLSKPAFKYELKKLKDILEEHGKLELFCWCVPKRCHAETIKKYLEENMEKK